MEKPRQATEKELREIYEPMVSPEGLKRITERFEPISNTHYETAPEGNKILIPEKRPIEKPKKSLDMRLADVPGVMFTLGPAYASCGIPFSLVQEFVNSDLGRGCEVFTYYTEFSFMPDIKGWENVVEVIEPEGWVKLRQFINECGFYHKDAIGDMYTLVCTELAVRDRKYGGFFDLQVVTVRDTDKLVMPTTHIETGAVCFYRVNAPNSNNMETIIRRMQ